MVQNFALPRTLQGLFISCLALAGPSAAQSVRHTPIVRAVEAVAPAVVNIAAESIVREVDPFFGFFFGERARRAQSLGSGLIVDRAGIVITNAHVIEGASRILVTTREGDERAAEILGMDRDSDLAVLKIDRGGLTSVPLSARQDLLIGETVIAVGNPFGLSHTVTTGVLSAVGRTVPAENGSSFYTDFLQTDASINPGNSGGPLVNLAGEVIGINTAIVAGADGIGFSIPSTRARRIVDDLLNFGELQPVWLGWRLRTLDPELARRIGSDERRGAIVERVYPASPAAAAGVQPGDVVVEVGGSPVQTREQVYGNYYSKAPATPLAVELERDGERRVLQLAAARAEDGLGRALFERELGVEVARDRRGGLMLQDVEPRGRARERGLIAGDALLAINSQRLGDFSDLDREVLRAVERGGLTLRIARGRRDYVLSFRF